MEAVPRLPMLSFDLLQSSEAVDFAPKLKQFIRNHYNEDPELFNNDIMQLEGLRSSAVHPTRDIAGCSTLKRYYCQLHFLNSRFPMHANGAAAVKFCWRDFNSSTVSSASDIILEMSSILYNIGALHSLLGAADNRTTAEGMKMSCTHFQCAAWAFQHICGEFAKADGLNLSLDLMTFMGKLCLGQAQECILEKSMMDNRKVSIIAKLSVQTVDYYRQALKIISGSADDITDSVGSKQIKKWEKYLKFKISYHGSISLLFQGQQAEEQQKMGERVAFFQASFEKLEEANKLAKGLDNIEAVNEALTFVHDIVEGKRKAAKNENEFIYHEDIPDISALPEVKGASLVKGIPFNVNDIEVSGPDIFSRLVPMKAHESSSLYSEEKAKLLRRVVGLIDNKDEELETFLSTLQLDDLNKCEGNYLPQELIDRCAALSAKPDAVQSLVDSMNKLSSIDHEVEVMLQEIREMLSEEELHEKEYQETVGKRPPTIVATDLTREAKKYQEAHSKASESNQTLNKAMLIHRANMKLMTLPLKELIKHVPTVVESPEVEAVIKEMKHLIDKINEMKQQRVTLSDKLRESLRQDDILRQVVTYNGENLQSLFESELQKHQTVISLIDQNLAAQENILKAVKDTYARYGATRKGTSEMLRRRESMIASLIASFDAYEDLIAKSAKGLDFYKKLEVNVSKLLQRVKGTCKVQDEEREQIIKSVKGPENSEILLPSNTPKLKDYLDMKKEFGKLSLDSTPVPPSNPYYKSSGNDYVVNNQSWIPGVRPAPVGSEETEATRIDSFSGFYQGRDHTWSTSQYPGNVDEKARYYQSEGATTSEVNKYTPDANFQTAAQDIYPISAYSSVMQNTSNTGYTGPKSNYYNTQNSPSRYVNPPNFYNDCNEKTVTEYGGMTQMQNIGATFSPSKSTPNIVVQQQPTVYNSTSGYTYPPSGPPQSINAAYSTTAYPANHGEISQAAFTQSNCQYPIGQTESKSPSAETIHSQSQYQAFPVENDPYKLQNATVLSQYSEYNSYTQDNTKLQNFSTAVGYAVAPNSTYPSQVASGFINTQNYQISTAPGIYDASTEQSRTNYHTSETNIASYNPNILQNYPPCEMSKAQDYSRASNEYSTHQDQSGINPKIDYTTNWHQNYIQGNVEYHDHQHMQSGNESLYTACQTNNYSLTNSDVYKTMGNQCETEGNYGNQYYYNQYGTLSGQNEYGLNYGNCATYIQAGQDKQATTKTTFTSSDAKSSPSAKNSNIDLLAGLDFNIGQSPLVPVTTPPPATEADVESTPNEKNTEEVAEKKDSVENSELTMRKDASSQLTNPAKDLFADAEKLNQLGQEVEKYEKFVESLTLKTLNGPTCLDLKWKEISDLQDKSAHLHIISVARCYPMKNRFADILPYDDSRIELPSTKDDYINASFVKNLSSQNRNYILTQAPLPSTYGDFWAMVFEHQVEVIVCLLSDSELDGHIYWPVEKGQEFSMGKLKISLQSSNVKAHWIERIMSISVVDTRSTRVVVHLQFTSWPGSSFPESPGPFLSFTNECINFFNQQRSAVHPIVVHCISGVGRAGLFCLIVTAISDIQSGRGIPDLVTITGQMSQYRKSPLRDREHLKFAYHAVLYYCQDLLLKQFPGQKSEASCRSRSCCSRQDSMTNSCSSSGRTSPSNLTSDVLTTVDPATFTLKLDGNNGKKITKKRFSTESFTKKSELSLDGFSTDSEDPLSRLDPLWTMKK